MRLLERLRALQKANILVIGDLMQDVYTYGEVKKISPEAPVGVLEAKKTVKRPGGAGNVMLNLSFLGAKVYAAGRVGDDEAGEEIAHHLKCKQVDLSGLSIEKGYQTSVKNRLIAGSQQLLRIDFESIQPMNQDLEEVMITSLTSLMEAVQIVAISDYAKGLLSPKVLKVIIQLARKHKVPVIVDPKGIDFTKYAQATIIKPNLQEAYGAANLPLDTPLEQVAQVLLEQSKATYLMITRASKGISLFDQNLTRSDFPVPSKEVRDVTGAGDTVLATVSFALANGLDIEDALSLANIAASIAIEKVGCATVSVSQIAERLAEAHAENLVYT